jgi:hypothetical protein
MSREVPFHRPGAGVLEPSRGFWNRQLCRFAAQFVKPLFVGLMRVHRVRLGPLDERRAGRTTEGALVVAQRGQTAKWSLN